MSGKGLSRFRCSHSLGMLGYWISASSNRTTSRLQFVSETFFVGRWFWNFCSPPYSYFCCNKRHKKKTYNIIKTQRMKTPSCQRSGLHTSAVDLFIRESWFDVWKQSRVDHRITCHILINQQTYQCWIPRNLFMFKDSLRTRGQKWFFSFAAASLRDQLWLARSQRKATHAIVLT